MELGEIIREVEFVPKKEPAPQHVPAEPAMVPEPAQK